MEDGSQARIDPLAFGSDPNKGMFSLISEHCRAFVTITVCPGNTIWKFISSGFKYVFMEGITNSIVDKAWLN